MTVIFLIFPRKKEFDIFPRTNSADNKPGDIFYFFSEKFIKIGLDI